MRRYLKFTDELSPLRQWRDRKTVDRLLYQTKRSLDEFYLRYREQAVQVITQKNNRQAELDNLKKKVESLQAEINEATQGDQQERANMLLKKYQKRKEELREAIEAFQQAEESCEQVKAAIKREREEILQMTMEKIGDQTKWKADAILKETQRQLQSLAM